jgi:hypothetical protein
MTKPHDSPTAAQLVEAVREFLEADVMGATEGRVQFHARVAAKVLAMVQRELELGPEQARRHGEGLAALGLAGERELALAIRDGAIDDQVAGVARFVRQTVEDKLAVANPGYFAPAGP